MKTLTQRHERDAGTCKVSDSDAWDICDVYDLCIMICDFWQYATWETDELDMNIIMRLLSYDNFMFIRFLLTHDDLMSCVEDTVLTEEPLASRCRHMELLRALGVVAIAPETKTMHMRVCANIVNLVNRYKLMRYLEMLTYIVWLQTGHEHFK